MQKLKGCYVVNLHNLYLSKPTSVCVLSRCILIHDESISEDEIEKQKQLDLKMNVYANGRWGNYTELPLSNDGTCSV